MHAVGAYSSLFGSLLLLFVFVFHGALAIIPHHMFYVALSVRSEMLLIVVTST